MYPDTDSVPIPLDDALIERIGQRLPIDVSEMVDRLQEWGVPADTFAYILRNNLFPLLRRMVDELKVEAVHAATLLGHTLKHMEGRYPRSPDFRYEHVYEVLRYLRDRKIRVELAEPMIEELYRHPRMDMDSVLATLKFKKRPEAEILAEIPVLKKIAEDSGVTPDPDARTRWMMGELRPAALGNVALARLHRLVRDDNSRTAERSGQESGRT
jgi:glutamyl-tRNA(Gln) amidotransferase subunit E